MTLPDPGSGGERPVAGGPGSGDRRRVATALAALAALVALAVVAGSVAAGGTAAGSPGSSVAPAVGSPVGPAAGSPESSVDPAVGSPEAAPDPPFDPTAAGDSLHGNHVTVGPQVVGDGRVVVESAALLADGFVAIHRDDDGERGELLGTAPLGLGTHTVVSVPVDVDRLPAGENVTLRATVYGDDGDGEFDEDDRPLTAFGGVADDTFTVRIGEETVRVVAADLQLRRSNGSVTVDLVDLPREGSLVVHEDRGRTLGEAVGRTALPAGSHRNVTVDVDPALFSAGGERLDLRAVAYVDGGDGTGDRPVRVGRAPVSGRLSVLTVANGGSTATTALVNTPEPTTTGAGTAEGTTPGSPGTSAVTDGTTVAGGDDGNGGSGGGGLPLPGFGAGLAAAALLLGAGFLVLRRR